MTQENPFIKDGKSVFGEKQTFEEWMEANPYMDDVTEEQWKKHMGAVEAMEANKEDMVRRIQEMAAFVNGQMAYSSEEGSKYKEHALAGTETLGEKHVRASNGKDTDWETPLKHDKEKYLKLLEEVAVGAEELRAEADKILGSVHDWMDVHLDPDGVPEWEEAFKAYWKIPRPEELRTKARMIERDQY